MSHLEAQTQHQAAQQQAAGPSEFTSTSLYVEDLEPNVSEHQLSDIFRQVGHVVSVRVCRHIITRQSLGYGHVNYNNASDAARALDLLNFTPVNGKPIRIMSSGDPADRRKTGIAIHSSRIRGLGSTVMPFWRRSPASTPSSPTRL
ncbi:unnamed protein product [Calypogeia fissa]